MLEQLFPDSRVRSLATILLRAIVLRLSRISFPEAIPLLKLDCAREGEISNPERFLESNRSKLNKLLDILLEEKLIQSFKMPGRILHEYPRPESLTAFETITPPQFEALVKHPTIDMDEEARMSLQPYTHQQSWIRPKPALYYQASSRGIALFRAELEEATPMVRATAINNFGKPCFCIPRHCADSLDRLWLDAMSRSDHGTEAWFRTQPVLSLVPEMLTADAFYPEVIILPSENNQIIALPLSEIANDRTLLSKMNSAWKAQGVAYALYPPHTTPFKLQFLLGDVRTTK